MLTLHLNVSTYLLALRDFRPLIPTPPHICLVKMGSWLSRKILNLQNIRKNLLKFFALHVVEFGLRTDNPISTLL